MAASALSASDRRRLWHPREAVCAVCARPPRGFGWRDPVRVPRRRPARWFCSPACQDLWTRRAGEGPGMIDLTEEEHAAVGAAVKRLALLMEEIGWSTRLAELSEPQVRALIEEAVEGFREAMADIAAAQAAQQPRIPF